MRYFVVSESGRASAAIGLSVAWVPAIVLFLALWLGIPRLAAAEEGFWCANCHHDAPGEYRAMVACTENQSQCPTTPHWYAPTETWTGTSCQYWFARCYYYQCVACDLWE